jgi:hypothetical protein
MSRPCEKDGVQFCGFSPGPNPPRVLHAPDPILATQGGSRRKARQSHRNLVVDQVAGDDDPVYDATVIVEGGLIKDVLTGA